RQDRPVLRLACAEAVAAGVLLCASSPARGEPVYPASYPGVIRVTGDARCAAGQWSWLDTPQADFGAAVGAAGVAGASLACAAFTGRVAALLREEPGMTRQALLHWLEQHAAFVGPERKESTDV
ncbi:subtilisin-like serine protease QhpE, partial [Pseudomonas soli]